MNRIALITGCSSGFGRRMVSVFLQKGWTVIATFRNAEERRHLFEHERATHGGRLELVSLDVTSPEERHRVVSSLFEREAGLDCLINNAGQMLLGALEEIDEEQLRQQFEVNLFGPVLLMRDVLPLLRLRRGVIINVSSIFGTMTWPLTSAYCSTKYALEGLTESVAQEIRRHGVRVVLLEPGSHPGTDLNRNIEWGRRATGGAYDAASQGYRAFRAELLRGQGQQGVDRVAQAAFRAATTSSVLRVRVGLGTGFIYRLVRWFPDWVGFRLMRIVAEKIFLRSSKAQAERR